jgi:hypothetical protein
MPTLCILIPSANDFSLWIITLNYEEMTARYWLYLKSFIWNVTAVISAHLWVNAAIFQQFMEVIIVSAVSPTKINLMEKSVIILNLSKPPCVGYFWHIFLVIVNCIFLWLILMLEKESSSVHGKNGKFVLYLCICNFSSNRRFMRQHSKPQSKLFLFWVDSRVASVLFQL